MNQADVDRKRKIAQALMGMQAPPPQMAGRFYVPPSPGAQIASGIGNVAGSFIDRKADTGQQQLDDQKKAELAKRLQELTGGSGDPRMASALAAIQGMPIEQQEAAVAQLASRNLTPQGPIKLGANDRLIDPNTMQTTVDAQPKPGKLVAVIGPDGKPTYVPEEQAAGMTPFRSGGVTVNTGSEFGSIPSGFRLVKSEDGNDVRYEKIPGGPSDIEDAADDADKSNVLSTYLAGREALMSGLEGATTAPILGKLPPLTENQQIAQGGVSVMAPILKQIFRQAGEGIFTDKDQELLLGMIPTREDLPAARQAKITAVDAIVAAKLGLPAPDPWVSKVANETEEQAPPEDVDPELWALLTPEERSLWK